MERFNIVVAVLLAGWVPSILMWWFSYTILTNTLESKILRDRQTFVQLTAHLVAEDLANTSATIEYYQTLPDFTKNFTPPNREATAQLGSMAHISHIRGLTGCFLLTRRVVSFRACPRPPR